MKFFGLKLWGLLFLSVSVSAIAAEFTGPAEWKPVRTDAIKKWNSEQLKKASPRYAVNDGVVADLDRREVKVLAEAVGHRAGITAEFLLVGPLSDRAYEAFAVTVATPSAIVKAMESLGVERGGGVGSEPFRFWPIGERVTLTVRELERDDSKPLPVTDFIADRDGELAKIATEGLVFTGGGWDGSGHCLTDTNMPSSVCSLYNEQSTVFDLPGQFSQSSVYGRLSIGKKLDHGALLEITFRPLFPADGKKRVARYMLSVAKSPDGKYSVSRKALGATPAVDAAAMPLEKALDWMKGESAAGRDLFVRIAMDGKLTLKEAAAAAKVFLMLDGKGLKLDGKVDGGVYPMAFQPQDKWRDRKDRVPQPFELHLTRGADGKIAKKLTFIEEDWSGESLDPKLTPKDYPFENWSELLPLVRKTGGPENKVHLLFVFAPGDSELNEIMPGVNAVASELQLVYLFAD